MALDEERRVQLALPTPAQLLTPGVVTLLVLMIVGYALFTWSDTARNVLMLIPGVTSFVQPWRLVSYPILDGFWGLVTSGLIVLFLGSLMERERGTGAFLIFSVAIVVACAVLWVAVGMVVDGWPCGIGAQALSYGLIAAFGLMHRKRRYFVFFWTMEAQHVAWLLIGIGLLASISSPHLLVWVAGAGAAYLYYRFLWDRSWRPSLGGGRSGGARFKDL